MMAVAICRLSLIYSGDDGCSERHGVQDIAGTFAVSRFDAAGCRAPCDISLGWWALTGSNRRPSRCKRDALPTELSAPSRGSRVIPPFLLLASHRFAERKGTERNPAEPRVPNYSRSGRAAGSDATSQLPWPSVWVRVPLAFGGGRENHNIHNNGGFLRVSG
jgi:hypothetical protein